MLLKQFLPFPVSSNPAAHRRLQGRRPARSGVHEIKHDGFRLMVRREGSKVRCFTKGGYDWADRFPAIVEAASRLKAESFVIDGEVVVLRDDGRSDFAALRGRRRNDAAVMIAFDLTASYWAV
jgi:bifunctional non-homologous end joining protein LigD